MRNKLWVRIFLRVSIIFLIFILIIALANSLMLYNFFVSKQQKLLIEQMQTVEELDLDDKSKTTEQLRSICDKYNFDIEIYMSSGNTVYTTVDSQIMDYHYFGNNNFNMKHKPLKITDAKDISGGTLFTGADTITGTEYIAFNKKIDSDVYAQIQIQKSLLITSAKTATEFITYISLICLAAALMWVFFFAKKFSRPIVQMNNITKDMAALNFDRTLNYSGNDEIGQLACSINNMSQKLNSTLENLRATNVKLKDEIELERSLDLMRRGFVANVSHELKTPIAIIQGYAEGLKLNINEQKREDYCDVIISESDRMNRLVLSILQLSKYESGQIPLEKSNFNIIPTLKQVTERIFKDTDCNTVFNLPDELYVFADMVMVEQVIKSYLENAKAHINPSGTLTLSAQVQNNRAKITVSNTGSSIDVQQMPLIWQSFYRGEKSHKRESSRFGLGLSIVSAICKMHGTDCGVISENDTASFWFTLELPN